MKMACMSTFDISREDLQALKLPASAVIADVKHLSSYNWIEAPGATPTIVVPGSPALWSPPTIPRTLQKDSGLVYIAQNAARHPKSPLEPLFRALSSTCPQFDINPIDVVTDRNNIRKLLSFVDGVSLRNGLDAFTMRVEITKRTAIFCREETNCVDVIGPQDFKGFGHEFEKAYTTDKINGSTGHYRIITYRFSDLNFLVRHETDGYIDVRAGTSDSHAEDHAQHDLSSMLNALALEPVSNQPVQSVLIVKKEGQAVPLESTLEIKTRVFHKSIDIQDVVPQLWVSQTPKLVRAYHKNGTFQRPVVEDVAAEIKGWELGKQDDLRRLAALVRRIVELARACGGYAVLRYDAHGDKLVISKAEKDLMLPLDLYTKWLDVHAVGTDEAHDYRPQGLSQEKTVAARSSEEHRTTTVKIGDAHYSVPLSKIPYLAGFVTRQRSVNPGLSEFVHAPIDLFEVALEGVESGYHRCFRYLPADLSHYQRIFETYKFLDVDVLGGTSMDVVIANLKVCRRDYDPDEGRSFPGNKRLAHDAAFQLLFVVLHTQHEDTNQSKLKLFDATLFIVSHPGTFKYRIKRVIRAAYEDRFALTIKQRQRLDQWDNVAAFEDVADVSTEEEADRYYQSDDSDDS